MKQTAVEWIFNELWNSPKDKFNWYAILQKAKEMEEKQIIEAKMDLQTAKEILEYHQEWRLGKRDDMIHEPKKLTQALDIMLKNFNTTKTMQKIELVAGLNESAQIIFQNNKEKGFWDKERNVGEMLMLVVSELGEAMEAHRKGIFADKLAWDTFNGTHQFQSTIKDTFEDELADAVIRLLDMSAGLGIDLEAHINAKVAYNATRQRLHGKGY
jgi:NTP pyrophosphatase (non-canonical NTP hydrolase)